MSNAFVVAGHGKDRDRVAVGSSLVIGRSTRCGLVVHDLAASRRHLEIRRADGGFTCRDLGSRNGTNVNGVPTNACELHDGDRIQIGQTVLRFEFGDHGDTEVPGKTVFLQTVLGPTGQEQEPPRPSKSKDLLAAAYTLLNAISTNFNPCDLVDRILEATMQGIQGQRGAILFGGPDGELAPCSVCGAVHTMENGEPRPAEVDEIRISESVARRVLRDGENVLYQSARTDPDVDISASIRSLNLTSILCVPIRTWNNILGILYIDTDIAGHSYTDDDLLLAAAAGNSAGLALENARIHQSLLESHRVEQEIADAWTIQESFLIKDWPTDDPRYEVYGETRPARTVGGDFYDFVRRDNDAVGVLIGDVSGKGVPAALMMAQLLAEFRQLAQERESPAEVLRGLNDSLVARSRRGRFCTISYVTIDLRSGEMVGASAGHHPTLLLSGERTTVMFEASGPPIGVVPDARWENRMVTIRSGETILLYTDGIMEARAGVAEDPSGEVVPEYEFERLERVARARSDCAPRGLIDAIMGDVVEYCAPLSPHDDCTMIALRFQDHGS
jgi:serine phosphatase RsbU (regulator of sigma subunit)